MKVDAPKDRIFCAIDTPSMEEAGLLAGLIKDEVGGLLLGDEFFTAVGPEGVRRLASTGLDILLDLKFHDDPDTVAAAVCSACSLGVSMLTVHASGGSRMLRAAIDAASANSNRRPSILAVTVLTGLDDADLDAVGQRGTVSDQSTRLATLARDSGVDGLMCAAHEISALRKVMGPDSLLVVSGVCPDWAKTSERHEFVPPAQAISAGADYIVVGHPIVRADDPIDAARRIADEISLI